MLLFVVENSKSHFVNLFDPHLLPCREIRDISAFDCNYLGEFTSPSLDSGGFREVLTMLPVQSILLTFTAA